MTTASRISPAATTRITVGDGRVRSRDIAGESRGCSSLRERPKVPATDGRPAAIPLPLVKPRLSMSAVAVAAFFALVVLPRTSVPLLDGDVWWHLRAGETVLDTGRVPGVDSWTIAGEGMRWISQDWLTNTLMAAVLRGGRELGMTLLSLLFAGFVVAAFALVWAAIGRRVPRVGWLARIGWLTLGLIVAGPIAGVRVQTVDLLMTAVAAWVLWSYLADRRARWLVALPLISLAWVNLHAGWPLLMALIGAVAVGEAGDRLVPRATGREPLSWPQLARLAAAGLVAFGVVAINPNGLAMVGYPFATASIAAHRDFIFEWSRPDLGSFPGQMVLVLMLVAVIPTLIVARRTMPLADALWLAGLAVMSLTAIRFALLAGPICAAIAAIHLSPRIAAWPRLHGLASVASRMERPPRAEQRIVNAVLAGLALVMGLVVAGAAGQRRTARRARSPVPCRSRRRPGCGTTTRRRESSTSMHGAATWAASFPRGASTSTAARTSTATRRSARMREPSPCRPIPRRSSPRLTLTPSSSGRTPPSPAGSTATAGGASTRSGGGRLGTLRSVAPSTR